MVKNLKKRVALAAAGASGALVSSASFAQASGASVDPTAVVASINGVAPAITAVGAAVIGIVVLAWGYKAVKGFLGR